MRPSDVDDIADELARAGFWVGPARMFADWLREMPHAAAAFAGVTVPPAQVRPEIEWNGVVHLATEQPGHKGWKMVNTRHDGMIQVESVDPDRPALKLVPPSMIREEYRDYIKRAPAHQEITGFPSQT